MNLKNINKILIIRLSSLGDILLTTPVIRSLKKILPNASIDFLVRKEFKDVVKHNIYLNNLFILERNYKNSKLKNKINNEKYDLIIDLQNNIRTNRLISKAHKIVKYKKSHVKKFFLVKFKLNNFKEIKSIPELYAQAVPNFKLDNEGLELFLPKNITAKIKYEDNVIGFCPGSKHKTKMWLKEYFIELGKMLAAKGYKIALFGGKDDKEICKSISDRIVNSIDLSNDNNLYDLAVNMKNCRTVICNDSGLMHTALSVKTPIIAIFGSTVKEFGFFPYKGKSLILENNSLNCRPCSHIGLSECPKTHFKCMKEIKPNYVFNETLKFIDNL
ncbi:MAG: hypothetical protein CR986_03190 [Ignavibacteriae bacterium]|nr:MAG: hypothetical protein CR986_03190 [Ignavibacteriota bacterium]